LAVPKVGSTRVPDDGASGAVPIPVPLKELGLRRLIVNNDAANQWRNRGVEVRHDAEIPIRSDMAVLVHEDVAALEHLVASKGAGGHRVGERETFVEGCLGAAFDVSEPDKIGR
jgi:hypothetical protein